MALIIVEHMNSPLEKSCASRRRDMLAEAPTPLMQERDFKGFTPVTLAAPAQALAQSHTGGLHPRASQHFRKRHYRYSLLPTDSKPCQISFLTCSVGTARRVMPVSLFMPINLIASSISRVSIGHFLVEYFLNLRSVSPESF